MEQLERMVIKAEERAIVATIVPLVIAGVPPERAGDYALLLHSTPVWLRHQLNSLAYEGS